MAFTRRVYVSPRGDTYCESLALKGLAKNLSKGFEAEC